MEYYEHEGPELPYPPPRKSRKFIPRPSLEVQFHTLRIKLSNIIDGCNSLLEEREERAEKGAVEDPDYRRDCRYDEDW